MTTTERGTTVQDHELQPCNSPERSSPQCTSHRHDGTRAGYQAGCRCPDAVAANRAYYREYNRVGREVAAWRERQNAYARRYQQRLRADPRTRAELRAKNRRQDAIRRARDRKNARRLIDPVVVGRLVNGEIVASNRPERLEAVRQLRGRGWSYPKIAARLGIAQRQVHRDLTDLGLIDHDDTLEVSA